MMESLFELRSSLFQIQLSLDEKAQTLVFEKFNNCLIDFCKKEKIKIFYYDTIEDLNNKGSLKRDKDDLAVGTYIRLIDHEHPKNVQITENYPQINLVKRQTHYLEVYTLAHEVGHHLGIKNLLDNSESIADHFILLLAEEFLTDIERHIISISLKCYSRIKMPEIKVKRKDWVKFKKEHKL